MYPVRFDRTWLTFWSADVNVSIRNFVVVPCYCVYSAFVMMIVLSISISGTIKEKEKASCCNSIPYIERWRVDKCSSPCVAFSSVVNDIRIDQLETRTGLISLTLCWLPLKNTSDIWFWKDFLFLRRQEFSVGNITGQSGLEAVATLFDNKKTYCRKFVWLAMLLQNLNYFATLMNGGV